MYLLPVITYVITLSNENKETSPMYQRPSLKLEFISFNLYIFKVSTLVIIFNLYNKKHVLTPITPCPIYAVLL